MAALRRSLRLFGRRLTRGLRALVVALAVLGLTPAAELMEHLVADDPPVAATSGEAGCADDCSEGCQDAGCHGDMHHCSCCGTGARALTRFTRWDMALNFGRAVGGARDRAPPAALDAPPLPPPRA